MLLDLCENSKITTAPTCILSEKVMDILRLGWKISVNKTRKSIQENISNENIDFVIDTILNSESPFVLFCKKIFPERYFEIIETVILKL